MYAYTGKIAHVDLSTGKVTDYPFSARERELYLGGKIMAAKIIYDLLPRKTDPYSPENAVVITTSPLTGTAAPCSSRFNVSTISPLTGLLVSSNCGGNFGLSLKRAGYDGLIITGKSPDKVYLDISPDGIACKDATGLWGKTTSQTQELLSPGGKLVIGPGGENMVRYASLVSQERAAGRGGAGAVFGAKNLKGLVARGTHTVALYRPQEFRALNRRWVKQLRAHPITGHRLPQLGTANLVRPMHRRQLLATRNYARGTYQDHDLISGETLREKYLVTNRGCPTCPIQCGRVVMVDGKAVKGPELETICLLGSNLLNNDLESIIRVNHLCDEYGIDTISFGSTVGLAMELNERGLWNNGLQFGDAGPLAELVELVAYRKGIGADLAEGTRRLSQKYGGQEFAMHVKGLELAAYEPRAAQGMGLGYATANRGGCHLNGGYTVVLEGLGLDVSGAATMGKAAFAVFFQDLMEAVSAGGTCLFTTYAVLPALLLNKPGGIAARLVNKLAPAAGGIVGLLHRRPRLMPIHLKALLPHTLAIQLATGFKMPLGKFLRIGERGFTLERLINLRQGLQPGDDTLPRRLLEEGATPVRLEKMLKKYYRLRGWTPAGVPSKGQLCRLRLAVEQEK